MTQTLREVNVIGLDTKSLGLHWVSNFRIGIDDSTYGWVTCSQTHEDPRRQADMRRCQIFHYAALLARSIPLGTKIYCEEPLALQNGATTRLLGLAAGAVWAAFEQNAHGVNWQWVDVSHWKKVVLGRGNPPKDFSLTPKATRTKRWIRECVLDNALFQSEADPTMIEDFDSQLDLYDAWAIRRFGVIKES